MPLRVLLPRMCVHCAVFDIGTVSTERNVLVTANVINSRVTSEGGGKPSGRADCPLILYKVGKWRRSYDTPPPEIDLSSPPVAIGTMEDGSFYITHESALGLVSFLDPVTGDIEEVGGFGAHGLMNPIELITQGGDQ